MATPKIFRRGKLLPAVFASMALPGIVIPQPVDGKHFYDGGLVEKTPLLSPIAEHGQTGDKRKGDEEGDLVAAAETDEHERAGA